MSDPHKFYCSDISDLDYDEDPPDMCATECPVCGTEFEVWHAVNYTNCPTCPAVFDPGYRDALTEIERMQEVS